MNVECGIIIDVIPGENIIGRDYLSVDKTKLQVMFRVGEGVR